MIFLFTKNGELKTEGRIILEKIDSMRKI